MDQLCSKAGSIELGEHSDEGVTENSANIDSSEEGAGDNDGDSDADLTLVGEEDVNEDTEGEVVQKWLVTVTKTVSSTTTQTVQSTLTTFP